MLMTRRFICARNQNLHLTKCGHGSRSLFKNKRS
jgi:hypothetical protein